MGTLYAAPPDIWTYSAPPTMLFGSADNGEQGIDQGSIALPTQIVGTGSGSITAGGIPRGAWNVRIRCVAGGEVNDSSTINPSAVALPSFQLSNDGGVTYSAPITVSDTRNRAYIKWAKFGMEFFFQNSTPPSYVAGDTWSCTTQPSADIVAMIPVASAYMDKFLVGSFDLPLTDFPPDFTAICCDLVRWRLIRKVGIAEKQDMQVYKPDEALAWLKEARDGAFIKQKTLGIVEKPPGTSFTMFQPKPRDPLWPPI